MNLIKFDAAKQALIEAASIDEVRDIRDKAEAVRMYSKQAGESLEMQNRCAEIKIRAERRAGQMLAEMPTIGKGKKCDTLSHLGVERHQSSRWQRIAKIPDDVFETRVKEICEKKQELTSAIFQRLAKTLEQQERDEEIAKEVHSEGVIEQLIVSGQKFRTIYADPPWQYSNQGTRASTNNHYGTMTVDRIADLPVADISEDKSILFLWTTNGFLFESERVIESWGFTFKSSMVWVKPQIGIGNYVRNAHEFLLIATRGGFIPDGKTQKSWIHADKLSHSRKPDEFRQAIERMAPGPRIELFARATFPGWTSWGNQIEKGLFTG